MLHRSRNSGRQCTWPTPLWVSSYTSCLKIKIHSAHAVPYPIHFMIYVFRVFFLFRKGKSLLKRSFKKLKEKMYLADQLPNVGQLVLTQAISCTKFKIHSAHADSPIAKPFNLLHNFSKDQSLLHRSRNLGGEYAWWTNSLVGQFLHQLSLIQSSRSIQHILKSHGQNIQISFAIF